MHPTTRTHFDPALYPRVYCVSRGYRVFLGIPAAITIIGGSIAIWSIATESKLYNPSGNAIAAAVFILLALGSAYLIAYVVRSSFTLRADAIVVQDVFTRKTILRSDIAGRRVLPT